LGVAAFETLDADVTTLRSAKRAESVRVALTQKGQPIFEALVWSTGDVSGLEHDVVAMPSKGDPDSLKTPRELLGDNYVGSPYAQFWANFDERVPTEDWIDDWENRPPLPPVAGGWYRYVPASTFADPWVDACRSVILLDTLGWPAAGRLHPRSEY